MGAPKVRQRIAGDAEQHYEAMQNFFREVLDAKKTVWLTCKHCHRKSETEVPDWRSRTHALEMMLNQGYGRPKEQQPDAQEFIVQRIIVMPDGESYELPEGARHVEC